MPDLHYEQKHGLARGQVICGVDEVGRGPLAGPVVACAVILPVGGLPTEIALRINDSKVMTERAREELFPLLTQLCRHSVAQASIEEITNLNILWASMLAMKRAIDGLGTDVAVALIDGNRVPPKLTCDAVPIIKGDGKSLSIASASIIAKVTRDRLMQKLAYENPGYGWEHNAGYGTAEHLRAIETLGLTQHHRPSFAPIRKMRDEKK